jgi:hypothetical protein
MLAEKAGGQTAEGRQDMVEGPGDRCFGERREAGGDGSGRNGPPGEEAPGGPAPIRKLALAAQDPLLGILNRLPGKDGKRWIVLPFSLEGLDVCLRILLAGGRAELMGLDIRDEEEVWRFVLHPGIPGPGGTDREPPWSLEFSRSPAPGKGRIKAVERELADFLGLPAERIRAGEGEAPVFAESRDWTLPSINKEV